LPIGVELSDVPICMAFVVSSVTLAVRFSNVRIDSAAR